ncbi:MAG: ATP-binding protein, partial [Polyangiaceae bacterium]
SANEKQLVDLHEAIMTTIAVARNEWKYVSELSTNFDANLPLVPCLRNELNQVILNLIVNSAHAIAEKGQTGTEAKGLISITTERVGNEAEIQVRDSGAGIPARVLARIYDPFFTTKPVGKGTGQGLAIARSVVVDKHGGTIRVETQPGLGTCFFIRLPLGQADDGAS